MADKKKSTAHKTAQESLSGSSHKSGKKEVKEMHIKKAANGGHVITHHHSGGEEPETHTTKTDDELSDHVMQHMGQQPNPGEDASNTAPDPSAAAGAGAGAGAGAPPAGAAAPQAGPAPAAPIPGM
jgi:hypothetical protein